MRIARVMCGLMAVAAVTVSFSAHAQTAKASLKDASGKDVGTVQLRQTPHGVLLKMSLKDLCSSWVSRTMYTQVIMDTHTVQSLILWALKKLTTCR